MKRRNEMKRVVAFLMIAFFMLTFSTSSIGSDNSSEPPSIGDIAGDVLVIRPLGLIGMTLGAAAFVISFPVTSLLKKTDQASEFLIKGPYDIYINKPLGHAGEPYVPE